MKKLVLLTLTLFAFLGCETEPLDPAILNNINQQSFQVLVDGQLFTSANASAVIANGQITITANSDTSNAKITMAIVSSQPGSYTNQVLATYLPTGNEAFSFVNIENSANGLVSTGVFNIVSINQTTQMISGTFQFVAHSTDVDNPGEEFQPKTLSSGIFNIPYTTGTGNPTDPTDPADGTFSAKIDGVQFNATDVAATLENGFTINAPNRILIMGSNSASSITLDFPDGVNNVAFPMSALDGSINCLPDITDPWSAYISINPFNPNAVVGSINITSHDVAARKISGTFQIKLFRMTTTGTVIGPLDITEGKFNNITYIDNTD